MLKTKCNTDKELIPITTAPIDTPSPIPTFDEVNRAIKSMKNGKASGIDTIPKEVWQIPQMAALLHKLIIKIWIAKTIPTEWRTAVIIPVPKPKKKAFRPVSLLVVAHKIYLKLILKRLTPTITEAAGSTQRGFLAKRSTMDNIMYLRRTRENALEFQLEKWIILSDVKGAFDTVNRSAVINVLEDRGASKHEVELVRDTLNGTQAIVRTSEDESKPFSMTNGVPQGSSLSPGLFIAAMGTAVNHANICIPTKHLEYADDMTNITTTPNEICKILANNCNALKLIGSSLEPSKTEILHISKEGKEEVFVVKEGVIEITSASKFEEVFVKKTNPTIKVLGDTLGPSNKTVNMRLSLANAAYGKFNESVWSRNNLNYITKIKIFKASIISIMTYGLMCHAANSKMLKKLDYFCLRKLKSIFRYEFDDKISYERIEAEMSFFNIPWQWPSNSVRKARVKYFIQSLDNEEFQQLLKPKPNEKRGLGRPRTRLIDVIVQDLNELKLLREGENNFTFETSLDSLPKKQQIISTEKAERVIKICEIHREKILENM